MHFVFFPFPSVFVPIDPCVSTLPMSFAFFPIANVLVSISPCVTSLSIWYAILPFPDVLDCKIFGGLVGTTLEN